MASFFNVILDFVSDEFSLKVHYIGEMGPRHLYFYHCTYVLLMLTSKQNISKK